MKTNKKCDLLHGTFVETQAARAADSCHSSLVTRHLRSGFTLIELLVVIAIIAILASMTLTVLAAAKTHAKVVKARLETQAIANAIVAYDSAYGRFPVSSGVQSAAPTGPTGDFTYGGSVFANNLAQFPAGYSLYTTNNSEVIAILMDQTNYPSTGAATVNVGHQKNPQQTIFLNATMSGYDPSQPGTPLPGVDKDLIYRDPWGNPYIISMDLNYDEQTKDAFYSLNAVSNGGRNGLTNPDGANATTDNWRYHGKVMVWSAGPNGKIDPGDPANDHENKDNVLSWK